MIVNVNLIATFKMIAGVRAVTLELPEHATLEDAVAAVLQQHPVLRAHWLNEKKELRGHVHVFINGDDANTLPLKLETVLNPNDEVDFIPPVAGG